MMALCVILILLLIIETILFIVYGRKRFSQNTIEKDELYQIQKEVNALSQQKTELLQDITNKKQEVEEIYEREKNKVSEQIKIYKDNASYASFNYIEILEQQYQENEKKYDEQMEILSQQEESLKNVIQEYITKIDNLKTTLNAGTRAMLRERQKQEEIEFYKLSITQVELDDILKLENIKLSLHQPIILSKLIWTTYFQKQASDMCNRILGVNKVCGIYKITDIKTGQCYIGQSVDVAQRWKSHIKCGLGIDASTTNKLYNLMQKDGVWNFTFELIEACPKTQLDEKEAFWIQMYEADKLGLNTNKGNKT